MPKVAKVTQHLSETRTETIALDLLSIRGWKTDKPPRGQLLRQNEYKDYQYLASVFAGRSKSGSGAALPDFLLLDEATRRPLMVIENKANENDLSKAIDEASTVYGQACIDQGFNVISVGVAGNSKSDIKIEVRKYIKGKWVQVIYNGSPISWIPTIPDVRRLLIDPDISDLTPSIPDNAVLAAKADEINRILRECGVKDEFRPAYTGAIMLALWKTGGSIRTDPDYILSDINHACQLAFRQAGKIDLAHILHIPEQNIKLAQRAWQICYILRALNISTLTSEHDYLGQLYETFFRYTGGNTIGQYFTPRHLTRFMADLCEVSSLDKVVDPACGTGGFLIACLQRVFSKEKLSYSQVVNLVKDKLVGYESEPITAALAVVNMILRGDGTTGIRQGDCFTASDYPIEKCNVALMNPPFPHVYTDVPTERFIERALEALDIRGQLAVIIPESLLTKNAHRAWRSKILENNTLCAAITLPKEIFQPYAASTTAILIFQKGIPHRENTQTFFCRIEYDGLTLKKGVRISRTDNKNELPKAIENYYNKTSIPNFCGMGVIKESDWSPGTYIPSDYIPNDDLKQGIDDILRILSSFYIRFAPSIVRQRLLLQSEAVFATRVGGSFSRQRRKAATNRQSNPNTVSGLFYTYYGQKELHSKERLVPGDGMVISSSGADNGCYGFFDFKNLLAPNFVTVPSTGSIGEAFVQTEACGVTDDCLILIPKEDTPEEALFVLAAVLRAEKWRFSYGRKMTPERIGDFKIPIDVDMISYVRQEWNSWEQVHEQALERYHNGEPLPPAVPLDKSEDSSSDPFPRQGTFFDTNT